MRIRLFKTEKNWIAETIKIIKSLNPKTIALSGGSTPKAIYQALSKEKLPWEKIHFYQVDERYVPQTNADSNYKLINETLLKNHETNFHFFDTTVPIKRSLAKYSRKLPKIFDLIILGIGKDGHTASLFPGSKALNSKSKVAHTTTQNFAVKNRLTITFPTILNSKNILVLLKNKPETLNALKKRTKTLVEFPAIKLLKSKNLLIHHLEN